MARYYEYQGKKLPSVTTITGQLDKPALTYWAANCAADFIRDEISKQEEISKENLLSVIEKSRKEWRKVGRTAMDIGSEVHACIETYLSKGEEPLRPQDAVENAFLAFLEWLDTWESWQTVHTEQTLFGEKYAGTCDWVVQLKHDLWDAPRLFVVDFKSSKGVYDEYKYQIAAYRHLIPGCEGSGILRLDKETGYPDWHDVSKSHHYDLMIFDCLTELFYLTNQF